MSIIESAVLKALKQSKSNDESKIKHLEDSMVEKSVAKEKLDTKSRSRSLSSLGNARKQILEMDQDRIFTSAELEEIGIVSPSMKDTLFLNKYRNLRTKLLSSSCKDNFITLVTSVSPGGGSSMVACNLAATFSLDEGKTSLLIDANINNPRLSEILQSTSKFGLIDYLESEELTRDNLLIKTPIPRLRLLPSGDVKVSGAEYFTSEKMKELVAHLLERYPERFPIIDAPSIVHSADTRILLDLCDKVILVVPYGKCSKEEIKYAALAIGKEKLAGIVLNEF